MTLSSLNECTFDENIFKLIPIIVDCWDRHFWDLYLGCSGHATVPRPLWKGCNDPLFLDPRAPLVQPSIGPSVPILYDDDDDEENKYDKDDKTGQVAGRQVAPYAASSSHSV